MPEPVNTNIPEWIKQKGDETTITVRVTPRASRSEIYGMETEWLKVRLKAPPVDGKANQELIAFFAKLLKLPKSNIRISSGESSRLKRIVINSTTTEDILKHL